MFDKLKALFDAGSIIKLLPDILQQILGGSFDPKTAIQKMGTARLNEQAGRSGGKSLGRAICEQIDAVMENDALGTIEQRVEIAQDLANNAALQLAQGGELVIGYPALQAAVVRAKAGQGDLAAARATRNAGTDRVKQSLVDVGRVVAGDAPRDL